MQFTLAAMTESVEDKQVAYLAMFGTSPSKPHGASTCLAIAAPATPGKR